MPAWHRIARYPSKSTRTKIYKTNDECFSGSKINKYPNLFIIAIQNFKWVKIGLFNLAL